MFFQKVALTGQCVIAAFCAMAMQNSYALSEQVSSFQTALIKVQQYHSQPDLQAQRQNLAKLNVKNSVLWQNPSLSIEQSGFKSDQERELSIGIRQPLDVFGQRKINEKIATLAQQQLGLQEQLWQAQSALIVKYAWSKFLLVEMESSIFSQQAKVSQANVESARKRYQAGSIALVDYERAQIEHLEIQRLHQQAVLNTQSAQRQLSHLWGESNPNLAVETPTLLWPNDSEKMVQQYIQQGWLEKLYALNVQQSKQHIERLKIQNRPQPTVNLGMTRTKNPDENNDTALAVGVEIPLNIFNRQQYTIPMAERQQHMLSQQQQIELKQQILDIANRLNELKGLNRQFNSAESQIVLSEKVQARTLMGFQAGKLTITDVQQATAQLQNLRLAKLQILTQAWQSALSAEALSLGTHYEAISQSDAYTQLNKTAFSTTQNLINGMGE